ncbi:hypothetical protein GCM10022251_75040 [Phytohabitans flavus]|uniref:Hemerythrin-like domain-containing protein n=2 Tax=Phytohabitans flavus TaxID=1076124 RepID=A0A6F8XLF2_9ACTN|nr:hypothetical protein Pflav_010470 [Phytohabitans flavus]
MYNELIAVHTIMRRGSGLITNAYDARAAGKPVDAKTLISTSRWFVGFVHHHHQSEDELFWPVLRRLFPQAVASLDALTAEHEVLDEELDKLAAAVDALRAGARAADAGLRSAERIEEVLLKHLDAEEPVLQELFQQVPDDDIIRLRKAIVDGAPKTGPHLVFGLMVDPERVPGYADMSANFPGVVRLLRRPLLRRYDKVKLALGQ